MNALLSSSSINVALGAIVTVVASYLLGHVLGSIYAFIRRALVLKSVPTAPDGNWLLGHVLPMVTCTSRGIGSWDQISEWATRMAPHKLIKFRILNTHAVAFSDPAGLKRVFQVDSACLWSLDH